MAVTDRAIGRSPLVRVCVGSRDDRGDAALAAARDAPGGVDAIEVGPTGADGLEPLVLATAGGTTAFHANASPEDVRRIATALADGSVRPGAAHAVVDHEPDVGTLPRPDDGPLSVGVRRVLGRCGWLPPASAADRDAFAAADGTDDPDGALDRIADVGLLGRGWGDARTDEPVVDAWNLARGADGDPVVVANAGGSDPSAFHDGLLVESAPIDVLDGAIAVARIVGAGDVVVSLNEADEVAHRRVRGAIEEAGDVADGVDVGAVVGPDRYIAGEPTMALEAMEGNDRLEARRRPPPPAEYGLYGRPTVVHTPRTLAQVREAILRPDGFDPADADPGTRLVRVAGDVAAPATVELPTGGSLSTALDAVDVGGRVKMACVGGRFGGLTRTLDVSAAAPALAAARLGTDGIVEAFGEDRCAVATAGERAAFAEAENCGRCVPCREGSKQLADLLRALYGGDYPAGKLRELARVVRETSLCGFGRAASRPVVTAMDEFEAEFVAHARGQCPAGACPEGGP